MRPINYKNLAIETISDTQLKFKTLHLRENLTDITEIDNKKILQISLSIIYSTHLKKLLSSKSNNRLLKNYYKFFNNSVNLSYCNRIPEDSINGNLGYIMTIAIQSLYEIISEKSKSRN